MTPLLKYWFIFVMVSFLLSILGLSWVQTRFFRRHGWHIVRAHEALDLYWRDLSAAERLLIWPGLLAFLLTLLGASLNLVFNRT
jgi:hypothetical protein